MGNVLFTNVRIIDCSGAEPYTGDVLVQGNRIQRVARGGRTQPPAGATVIDAAGATLMPGMVEAHTHFSWNDAATLIEIQRMPLEEHVLWAASVAERYLEAGFTSCVGAACAKPRLDVVVRNAIEEGLIPGPRYLAASQEITVAGGLGDETLPHIPWPEFSFGVVVSGPEEMRKAVRMFLKYGVDSIKLNLSGDNFVSSARAETTWMSDEEVAIAVKEARMRGKRLAAHARSCESIKQCVRHGIEIIYHASFTDEEALDMLEANKRQALRCAGHRHPLRHAERGRSPGASPARRPSTWATRPSGKRPASRCARCTSAASACCPAGDYGFAFTPHCQNARDLEFFVKYLGFTPMEALLSATRYGGETMMRGGELGQIKEGFLADLLLVDGDPLANLAMLREPSRMLAVMKDGVFYKEPEMRAARARWGLSAA